MDDLYQQAQAESDRIENEGRQAALEQAAAWCLAQADGELCPGNVRELVLLAYRAGFAAGNRASETYHAVFGVYL